MIVLPIAHPVEYIEFIKYFHVLYFLGLYIYNSNNRALAVLHYFSHPSFPFISSFFHFPAVRVPRCAQHCHNDIFELFHVHFITRDKEFPLQLLFPPSHFPFFVFSPLLTFSLPSSVIIIIIIYPIHLRFLHFPSAPFLFIFFLFTFYFIFTSLFRPS